MRSWEWNAVFWSLLVGRKAINVLFINTKSYWYWFVEDFRKHGTAIEEFTLWRDKDEFCKAVWSNILDGTITIIIVAHLTVPQYRLYEDSNVNSLMFDEKWIKKRWKINTMLSTLNNSGSGNIKLSFISPPYILHHSLYKSSFDREFLCIVYISRKWTRVNNYETSA